MSLLRRMAGMETRASSTLKEPADWLWDALGASPSYSGKSVNQKTSLELDAVWACVALLARSIGQMPLIVYRGSGRERERAKGSPQWKLLHERPAPSIQPDVFVETIVALENLWGNFYAEKVKGGRAGRQVVGELWPISPAAVTVERDKRGAKRFSINGESRAYTASEILHIPGFGYDGIEGLSPIAMFRNTLGGEAARDEWSGRWYANAAHPSGVLQSPDTLSPEAITRLKASWEAAHRGLSNFGRTAVLEAGVSWQQSEMPRSDQQFIEQNRFGVNRIARIFQVPPEKIGGERASSNTYSNVQSANLDFVIFSLQHWMVRIEQGLKFDLDIFPDGLDLYPEFLAEGLLRGDPEARSKFYDTMAKLQAITIEEIRERENLGPIRDGDTFAPVPGAAPEETEEPEVEPTSNGRVPVVA